MKKLLLSIAILFTCGVYAQETSIPPSKGFVNDLEDIYTPEQEDSLTSLIKAYRDSTANEIALVTIAPSMVSDSAFEGYTLRLLRTWGVGQKEKNNGILIAISSGYRRMRIQHGYGIQKVLSDAETKKIIDDYFLPFFKKGKMFDGTYNGLKAIINKVPAL